MRSIAETNFRRQAPTPTATICSASCIHLRLRAAGPAASTSNTGKQACAQAANLLSGVPHTSSRPNKYKNSVRSSAMYPHSLSAACEQLYGNSRSRLLLCSPNSASLQGCRTAHMGAPLRCCQSSLRHPPRLPLSDWPVPRLRLVADGRHTQELSTSRTCC